MMSITGTLVMVEVKLNEAGMNSHELSSGMLEHAEADSEAEPVKPAAAWKFNMVEPCSPGLPTRMRLGLAEIANVLLTVTWTGAEFEP